MYKLQKKKKKKVDLCLFPPLTGPRHNVGKVKFTSGAFTAKILLIVTRLQWNCISFKSRGRVISAVLLKRKSQSESINTRDDLTFRSGVAQGGRRPSAPCWSTTEREAQGKHDTDTDV